MTAETKIIGGTGSVPSKASDDQRAPVAAVVYARRKHPTLVKRRYKTPARTSQTLHAIVQRKNFAEICPLVRMRHKPGAPDFPERISISPQPILDCATSGRKILSANVAGRRRVRVISSTAHS